MINLRFSLLCALSLSACSDNGSVIPENFPWDLSAEITISGPDGEIFRVVQPGETEWDDYVEMSKHSRFASYLDGRQGYAMPYDPEWRSTIDGYRKASRNEQPLHGGVASIDELANRILNQIQVGAIDSLRNLAIDESEFVQICWPSFPQSRPYVRIPVSDAWSLQYADNLSGPAILLRDYAALPLRLERVELESSQNFPPNFTLHQGVRLHVWNAETQERSVLGNVGAIIEKDGRFKVYKYND